MFSYSQTTLLKLWYLQKQSVSFKRSFISADLAVIAKVKNTGK